MGSTLHYDTEGKHFNFKKAGGIRIEDQTTGRIMDTAKTQEQTTGVHEKAHGDFGMRYAKLVETGEDHQFVKEIIQHLEDNRVWERSATKVVTGWPLSALGVNNSELQAILDESIKNESFTLHSFLNLAQEKLGENDYFTLQNGIVNEINSIAAESGNKIISKIICEVFIKTQAGGMDLPAEV